MSTNQASKKGIQPETALLSVTEALQITKAASNSSVLILLDLSAFDTVIHQILLSTLSWASLELPSTGLSPISQVGPSGSHGEARYPKHLN